jgi:glycosyltransferase involved in cell wall biosynthesis
MTRSLNLGGTERQTAEIAMSLDRTLFRPTVACFHMGGVRADDLTRAGVTVVEFPVRSFGRLGTARIAWQFHGWLRRQRIALVHPFDVPTVLFGAPVARAARVPVVLSSQRGDRRLYPQRYHPALRVIDRIVDGVVVNSDYIREVLATEFGVPDGRMHTCRNGLDTSVFHPGNRTHRPEIRTEGLVVGIVAALRSEKSIETLIDAFSRVSRGVHQLVIVGDGPSKEALQKRVQAAAIEPFCTFAPATEDVASWYRSIDIFVLPSVNESFSNSLMEAMACGCSVIASRVGGNTELVRDEDNGLLFDAGNAAHLARQLGRLLQDGVLCRRLAAAAIRTIHEGYTREIAAHRFGALYQQLLSRA